MTSPMPASPVDQWLTEDPEVLALLGAEAERQATTVQLIASENFTSTAVMAATGSVLTQAAGVAATMAWSGGVSALLLWLINRIIGLRVSPDADTTASAYADTWANSALSWRRNWNASAICGRPFAEVCSVRWTL